MARNTDKDAARKIGARFRVLREAAGLTQRELAAAMREAGFEQWDEQTVTNITTGIRQIAIPEIGPLAALLNTDADGLVVEPLDQPPPPRRRPDRGPTVRIGEIDPDTGAAEMAAPLRLWPGRLSALKQLADGLGVKHAVMQRRCLELGLKEYGVVFPDTEARMRSRRG